MSSFPLSTGTEFDGTRFVDARSRSSQLRTWLARIAMVGAFGVGVAAILTAAGAFPWG